MREVFSMLSAADITRLLLDGALNRRYPLKLERLCRFALLFPSSGLHTAPVTVHELAILFGCKLLAAHSSKHFSFFSASVDARVNQSFFDA